MTNKLLLKENLLNFEFFKLNDVIVRRFEDLAFKNRLFQEVLAYSRPSQNLHPRIFHPFKSFQIQTQIYQGHI